MRPASIDVVIPVFNGERYIEEALRSVFSQSLLPTSLIIVNDGSTDSTVQVIEKTLKDAPASLEVKVVSQKNSGLSNARNTGIRNGISSWVAFLDADDIWHPDKLLKQWKTEAESKYSKLGLVYCGFHVFSSEERTSHAATLPHPKHRGRLLHELYQGVIITGSASAAVISRQALSEVGLFDESLSACEDWDLWLRIAERYDIDYVPEDLVGIRVHSSNMQKDFSRMVENDLAVISMAKSRNPADAKLIRRGYLHKLTGWSPGRVLPLVFGAPQFTSQSLAECWNWLFPTVRSKVIFLVRYLLIKLHRRLK